MYYLKKVERYIHTFEYKRWVYKIVFLASYMNIRVNAMHINYFARPTQIKLFPACVSVRLIYTNKLYIMFNKCIKMNGFLLLFHFLFGDMDWGPMPPYRVNVKVKYNIKNWQCKPNIWYCSIERSTVVFNAFEKGKFFPIINIRFQPEQNQT